MNKIKVLNFNALSYSGTTWLNLLLGSHPDVFALGPPHRVWALKDDDFKGACLVHGPKCEFWSSFSEAWNRDDNFFVALSQFSGKGIFLMDNAPPDFIAETMQDPAIEVLEGRYIRDARAITASYARKMADKRVSYIESIQPDGWFYPSFMAVPSLQELSKKQHLIVHYEDAVSDQSAFLKNAGDFLGINYDQSAFRFWEADHHITSGNQGPIAMIKLHQEENVGNFESKAVYEEQLERLKQNPTKAFSDERWRSQLTDDDLKEFDLLLGQQNQKLGYERDIFKLSTMSKVKTNLCTLQSKFKKIILFIANQKR